MVLKTIARLQNRDFESLNEKCQLDSSGRLFLRLAKLGKDLDRRDLQRRMVRAGSTAASTDDPEA